MSICIDPITLPKLVYRKILILEYSIYATDKIHYNHKAVSVKRPST